MKLKKLTMLTLSISALIGSVSANAADPVTSTSTSTSTSTWNATATVETTAKLSIIQDKESLSFTFNSAKNAFNADHDTLTAILRSDTDAGLEDEDKTTGLTIKAALTGNTLTNVDKHLSVLASIGETSITAQGVSIFDSSTTGNVAFESFTKDTVIDNLQNGAQSSAIVDFNIDYYKGKTSAGSDVTLKEGKYEGKVQIQFTTNWTHGA